MQSRDYKRFAGHFTLLIGLCLLYALIPLGTAIDLGADEGFALMKALLWSKGYHLYSQIWSDQPPLWTIILGMICRWFGPAILPAHLLTAAFSLTFFLTHFELVRHRLGTAAGLFASVLLVASPIVLQLSLCTMQEVPTFTLGLLALLVVIKFAPKQRWWAIFASAALFGVALQIKLTAALLLPALFVELCLAHPANNRLAWIKNVVTNLLLWSAVTLSTFALLAWKFGFGGYHSLIQPHVVSVYVPDFEPLEHHVFPVNLLWKHAEGFIAAVVGIELARRRKRLRDLAAPLVLLATVSCVHPFHRPWWDYYYLHFAIALSWLGGFACAVLLNRCRAPFAVVRWSKTGQLRGSTLALAALLALPLARSEGRLEANVKGLRHRPRISTSPLLAKIMAYRQNTRWMYANKVIYPFQAGILVPPELAIVSPKRFWSGQIDWERILELIQQYRPEQLLLANRDLKDDWKTWVSENYRAVYQDKAFILYVSKELPEPTGTQATPR